MNTTTCETLNQVMRNIRDEAIKDGINSYRKRAKFNADITKALYGDRVNKIIEKIYEQEEYTKYLQNILKYC